MRAPRQTGPRLLACAVLGLSLALTGCGSAGGDPNEVIVPIGVVLEETTASTSPPNGPTGDSGGDWASDQASQEPPSSTTPAPNAQPSALETPTATPLSPPAATPSVAVTMDADQMPHSDTPASGEYVASSITLQPATETAKRHRYIVHVESSLGLDADELAREVHAILTDPRGWTGFQGNQHSFELVNDQARADLDLYVTSPATTDQLCAPLQTKRTWNCQNGKRVIVNSDRWLYMTPTYTDLSEYRAYLINHEVGHFIGFGHANCPREGANAPVMLQQSMRLQGCKPNAWPAEQG